MSATKQKPDKDENKRGAELPQKLCAFIDLVGTKNLAAAEAALYFEALKKFQRHLADLCNRLDGGHIYFFSDCAFFEHSDLVTFLDFFLELRRVLFQDGLYFKGGVMRGNLDPVAGYDHFEVKNSSVAALRKRTLFGYFFSADAAQLYSIQERMRGIGTHVDSTLDGVEGLETVNSCYVPSPPAKGVHAYRDIRLRAKDMTRGNLATLLSEFYYAKARSRKLGRYYISPLVVWLQSIELSSIRLAHSRDDDLVNLILHGRFEQLLGDSPGLGVVYLTLLNRVFTEQATVPNDLYDAVRDFAKKHRTMFRELEGIPLEILSHKARRKCVGILTSSVIQTSQEYKDITDLVTGYVQDGLLQGDIVRKLVSQRAKFERATGRELTPLAVKALIRKERIAAG
jgi:hypothetical protein